MPLIYVGTWALALIGIGGIITMIHSVIAKLIYGKQKLIIPASTRIEDTKAYIYLHRLNSFSILLSEIMLIFETSGLFPSIHNV